MDAIKYLKFDLRIMKENKQYIYFASIPIFTVAMLKYWEIGMKCLLVFSILYIVIPFSNENSGRLEKIYSLLPGKTSSMVLGRFIYLSTIITINISICLITALYYFSQNSFQMLTMMDMIIFAALLSIISYCSYPLCYKAQLEKDDIVTNVVISIILLVAILILVFIAAEMKMINSLYSKELNIIGTFILNNNKIFSVLYTLVIGTIGYISYLCSCRICKRKEV